MAFAYSPKIVTDGLVFCFDYANTKSYISGSSTVSDIIGNVANGTITNINTSGDSFNTQYKGFTRTSTNVPTRTTISSIDNSSPITFNASGSGASTEFSLECVFQPSAFAAGTNFGLENVLIAKGAFGTLNYLMQINSSQLTFCHRSPNETLKYTDFSTTFTAGNVYHAVLTVTDSQASQGNVRGYNNGEYLGETSLLGDPIQPDSDASDPFYFPAGGGTANNYHNFLGTYYTCRIYNKRLTSDEVLQNYNALTARFRL
jgi:hypothetical protein